MRGDAVEREFAAAMARFAPFEPALHLAVALSGGADSSALLLLAAAWARIRGGRVTALTVDHRLRAGSAEEAARVAGSCAARGIAHATLVWDADRPATGVQAAARAARYCLLSGWCRDAGVLHLLLGHHDDDQRETQALRAARGSGPDGRAGMSAIVERRDLRVLRPLLGVPRAAVRAWLAARGEAWVEDPSNADLRFARARLRAAGGAPAGPGGAAAARVDAETALARFLARHAAIHPEGRVELEAGAFAAADPALVAAALGRVLATVGGRERPPRGRELAALAAALAEGKGARTLGGCRIAWSGGRIAVAREPGAIAGPETVDAAGRGRWDGRFEVRGAAPGDRIGALGRAGLAALGRAHPGRSPPGQGPAGAAILPALRGVDGSLAAPHLFCGRFGAGLDTVSPVFVAFRPLRPLAGARFAPTPAAEPAPGPTSEHGVQPLTRPDAA